MRTGRCRFRWCASAVTGAAVVAIVAGALYLRSSASWPSTADLAAPGPFFGHTPGSLYVGDLVGSETEEILVATDSGASILRRGARESQHIEFDSERWRIVALFDWDRDGKQDLVLSAMDSPVPHVRIRNALGDTVFDAALHRGLDGAVYQAAHGSGRTLRLAAYPNDNSAPRAVVSYEAGAPSEGPTIQPIGPLPVAFVEGPVGIGVSTRAAGRTGGVQWNAPTPPDRCAQVVVGAPPVAVGASVRHGFLRSDQASQVDTIPFSDDRLIRLVHHPSSVYGGRARVERVDSGGNVIRAIVGPAKTAISASVVHRGSTAYLLFAWRDTGELFLVNADLQVVASARLPGRSPFVHVFGEQDGHKGWLVSSGDTVYRVDENLAITGRYQCDGLVTDVIRFPDDAERGLVRTDRIAEFAFEVSPPTRDGLPLETASGNPDPVGSLPSRIPDWGRFETVPIPDRAYIADLGAVDSDDVDDILVHYRDDPRRYRVVSLAGETIAAGLFPLPVRMLRIVGGRIFGPVSVDGEHGVGSVDPLNSREDTVIRMLTYAYDSDISVLAHDEQSILVRLITSYMLAPRGVYALNPDDYSIRFFVPSAGYTFRAHIRSDGYYFDYSTPTNGAVLIHRNGTREDDTSGYLHAVDHLGTPLDAAGGFRGVGDTAGGFIVTFFDYDDDGQDEAVVIGRKDPDYYPGFPLVVAAGSEQREVVHIGPVDSSAISSVTQPNDEPYLLIYWRSEALLEVLDRDFSVVTSTRFPEVQWARFIDLHADGVPQLLVNLNDRLEIVDPLHPEQRIIVVSGGDRLRARPVDVGRGVPRALLVSDGESYAVVAPRPR